MDHYLDIIVFAVIAVVLLFRLRSVLGTQSDNDPAPLQLNQQQKPVAATDDEAMALTDTPRLPDRWTQNLPNYEVVETATVHNNLTRFVAVDPAFRPDDFLNKAKKAYLMIVGGFASGNRSRLEFLLAPNLYQEFVQQIDAREKAGETFELQNALKKAIISEADLDGTTARVEVSFTAEQSVTRKDSEGRFIDAQNGQRHTTRDRWVFTKDLKDPSPSWLLADTLEFADI